MSFQTLSFIFETQIKMFLMITERFLSLHWKSIPKNLSCFEKFGLFLCIKQVWLGLHLGGFEDERKSYRFGSSWVTDDFHFWVNYPFNSDILSMLAFCVQTIFVQWLLNYTTEHCPRPFFVPYIMMQFSSSNKVKKAQIRYLF